MLQITISIEKRTKPLLNPFGLIYLLFGTVTVTFALLMMCSAKAFLKDFEFMIMVATLASSGVLFLVAAFLRPRGEIDFDTIFFLVVGLACLSVSSLILLVHY